MMCGCVLSRPRISYAVLAVGLQAVMYLAVLYDTSFLSGQNKLVGVMFGLGAAIVSLLTNYCLESFSRRSFLLQRRVELLNRELERQSLTDPLTKLANRRSFEKETSRYWSDPSRQTQPVAFVLIDIDNFKLFNDTFGHAAGDVCLIRVASRVAAAVPPDRGLAVRFGGEEIILFLLGLDAAQATAIAEQLRLSILGEAIPHATETLSAVVTASFGVAAATAESCDILDLVVKADRALYAAKKSGRNRVWPPPGLPVEAQARGVSWPLDRPVAA